MYAEKLKQFENVENLGGKAWEHAKALQQQAKQHLEQLVLGD